MTTATEPPAGFHSVTPRMVVSDVAAAVEFLRAVFDATGEALAAILRPGNAAAGSAEDHVRLLDAALAQLPVDLTGDDNRTRRVQSH